jgi:hypothetical protein
VFIDNVPYTKEALTDIKLPEGKHKIRVTAANYQDEERTLKVTLSMPTEYFVLKEVKHEIVKHKGERTRTNINIRNHWDLLLGADSYGTGEMDYIIRLTKTNHFGGLLARQWGLTAGIPHKYNAEESEDNFYYAGLSLGYGISIPFGTYNQFLFSSFFSGFGRYRFTEDEALAFGTRISARLDINNFIIEVNGTYSPNYRNKFYPSLMLGYKFNL